MQGMAASRLAVFFLDESCTSSSSESEKGPGKGENIKIGRKYAGTCSEHARHMFGTCWKCSDMSGSVRESTAKTCADKFGTCSEHVLELLEIRGTCGESRGYVWVMFGNVRNMLGTCLGKSRKNNFRLNQGIPKDCRGGEPRSV